MGSGNMAFDQFSHNSEDTIYHQKSATGMRFAFLVVSEYFDTPSHGVTQVLDEIVEHLNTKQAESEEEAEAEKAEAAADRERAEWERRTGFTEDDFA